MALISFLYGLAYDENFRVDKEMETTFFGKGSLLYALGFYYSDPQRMSAAFIVITLLYGDYCNENPQRGLS